MHKPWGYSLHLDCSAGKVDLVSDGNNILNFIKELVPAIEMKAFGEPEIVHFGEDEKLGYTLIQKIETSSITGHFCDNTGDFYIDVFSCKEFDNEVVLYVVNKYFEPTNVNVHFLVRQA